MKLKRINRIDSGGFGNVDLVEDEDGHVYARKTFSKNQPFPDDLLPNVLRRFRKEAKIQESIQHRNIVPVLGGDLAADPPFYLMPVAESSLAKDIAKDRTLGGEFVAALSDIVAGLEELHSMGIFHRDLKPQNVLRLADANGSFYAIGDFGLISMKESQLSTLTKTGMAKGSDYYTAPEITRDLRLASPQSDIYSLGCILHEMVGTEDRVPCGEIREPGEFSGILLGCTRKDPKLRFKTVRAVLDAVLSVGISGGTPPTKKSTDFISALDGPDPLTGGFWNEIAEFLDREASAKERNAIFIALSSERIAEVCNIAPQGAEVIARQFASWVAETGFGFEYCDALSNRLEEFFENCSFESKCDCLLAMLELGTSHNRWYVERKFFRICGPTMETNLAKRLAIEFRIRDVAVCGQIQHLERSISVNRSNMHPELVRALTEICK